MGAGGGGNERRNTAWWRRVWVCVSVLRQGIDVVSRAQQAGSPTRQGMNGSGACAVVQSHARVYCLSVSGSRYSWLLLWRYRSRPLCSSQAFSLFSLPSPHTARRY